MQKVICDLCTDVFCPKRKVRSYKCNKFMTKEFDKEKSALVEQIETLQDSLQCEQANNRKLLAKVESKERENQDKELTCASQDSRIHAQSHAIEELTSEARNFKKSVFYKGYKFLNV